MMSQREEKPQRRDATPEGPPTVEPGVPLPGRVEKGPEVDTIKPPPPDVEYRAGAVSDPSSTRTAQGALPEQTAEELDLDTPQDAPVGGDVIDHWGQGPRKTPPEKRRRS